MSKGLEAAKILADAFDKALDILERVLTAAVDDRAALDAAKSQVASLTSQLTTANEQIQVFSDEDASASSIIEGISSKLDGLVVKASAAQPPVPSL